MMASISISRVLPLIVAVLAADITGNARGRQGAHTAQLEEKLPPPVTTRGSWVPSRANPLVDAPSLHRSYRYLLPNSAWVDPVKGRGYLLAHVRHDDGDRYIHLFAFDPSRPESLAHEGQLLAPLGPTEARGKGGILEASLNVVDGTAFIHYMSWTADGSVDTGHTLLATANVDDIKTTIIRQGVAIADRKANVVYKNGVFYAVNGSPNLTKPDLWVSRDGLNFVVRSSPLFDTGGRYYVDMGAHLEVVSDSLFWLTHYDKAARALHAHSLEVTGAGVRRTDLGNVLTPFGGEGDGGIVDSPAIFTWKGRWYMYVAGAPPSERADDYSGSKIHLCEWKPAGPDRARSR